jgi:uncharacterized protein
MKFLYLFIAMIPGNAMMAQKTDSTQKQFLAVMTLVQKYTNEKNWTSADNQVIKEHAQYLLTNKNEGKIILAGRTDYKPDHPDIMGLIIFYAKNDTEALQFIQNDPAVKNNIMTTKVHPYRIAVSKCD